MTFGSNSYLVQINKTDCFYFILGWDTAPPSGGMVILLPSAVLRLRVGVRASLSWRHRRPSTRMRIVVRTTFRTPLKGEWFLVSIGCVWRLLSKAYRLGFACHAIRNRAPPRCRIIFSHREISDVVFLLCFYTRIVLIGLLDVWYILMNEHQ